MTNNNFNDYITDLIKTADLLKEVAPNMTINDKDVNVQPEKEVQARIEEAVNASQEDQVIAASLDAFTLTDDGTPYLQVKHAALNSASLGKVGKNEYATSKDKAALLKSIIKDAFPQTKISFTNSFVEPVIEKVARGCDQCEASMINGVFCHETGCPNQRKEREQEDVELESKIEPKKSWLGDMEPPMTDLETPMAGAEFMEYECPVCKETFEDFDLGQHSKLCPGTPEVMHDKPAIAINENMPMAHASDSLAQSMQAEQQNVYAAQEKIKIEAVNALVSMLKSQGYGTTKAMEVTASDGKFDVMVTLDSEGALRAVNIPVGVKDGQVVLPKKSLVSQLVKSGLDIQAKLAESFSQEVLNKIAETELKMQYEIDEANSIIAERPVPFVKEANESRNTMFEGDTDTLTVQKHLLPNHETMKLHDKVSDGTDSWEIVNMESQQLDKNENSSSLWTLKKVAPPKDDGKEPKEKMSI